MQCYTLGRRLFFLFLRSAEILVLRPSAYSGGRRSGAIGRVAESAKSRGVALAAKPNAYKRFLGAKVGLDLCWDCRSR